MKVLIRFMLAMVCLMLSSCKSMQSFYQICDVRSSLNITSTGEYEYKDAFCKVSYDFWCNGGNPGFLFTNDTDEILYVDLSKSFLIKNGIAYDYFLNRMTSAESSFTQSYTSAKSGSVYGFWNRFYPGTKTSSVGINNSTHSSNSITNVEKSIISIPPHTSKIVVEYNIASVEFFSCDFNMTPGNKNIFKYDFTKEDSPVNFGNYITYRVGDDMKEHVITNNFYISAITICNEKNAKKTIDVGCKNKKELVEVFKDEAPNKFYILYYRDTANKEIIYDF